MSYENGVPRTRAPGTPPSGYQSQVLRASLRKLTGNWNSLFGRSHTRLIIPASFERGGENWAPDTLYFSTSYRVLAESLALQREQILESLN
jgi:hypothetical protein